jgi:hypothetical protein
MPHPKVRIEDDTIDAVVTAEEKILVKLTESIHHSEEGYRCTASQCSRTAGGRYWLIADGFCCPEGA